jgi:NAD(P)H-dependent FMN reductase
MSASRILAFSGSTRTASFNKRLARIAAQGAREAGAEVDFIDLRDYPLPLFDEDIEVAGGLPENARRLRTLLQASDGLLIASPEYNSSVSGVLKNVIDWASRSESVDEVPLACFKGRVAALLSASGSGLGGVRGLVHLRSILSNIGVIVLPEQVTVPVAYDAVTEAGVLKDERRQRMVASLGRQLAEITARLRG